MSGVITRKQIIEDEALAWGENYAKNLQPAVDKNKEFIASILALNEANNQLRGSRNDKELQANLKKTNELGEKAITVWKEQNQLELALISTKRKNQLATEGTNQALIKERVELQATNKVMKQAALEQLGMVSAYTKLNNSRTAAKDKLRDLLVAEEKNIKAIKAAQKEYDILDSKIRKADAAVGDFTKNVGNYPFQNAANGLKNLIGAFGVTTGIALFASIMKGAFDTIKKFEQGIADLSAITGAIGKDLDYLRRQAVELGKGVEGGAIAVVEAYKLIASAKPELLENVDALNSVTKAAVTLAQAAGIELPDAATALTDALNQFNLPADQAGAFIDALANGAKYGAAEIPQITEALLKFGAVARSSNINIKESTALIELLAENGLKGADAGTALRNVLLKISAPDALPLKAKEAIQSLGISFETLKDKTIPIQQKLELLRPLLTDNAKMVKIFGLENVVAAQNIIGHTDRLKELTDKMGEFGTAEEQARIRMDTLKGRTIELTSTYDSFILSVDNGKGVFSNAFKFMAESAIGFLQQLERINSSWDELFVKAKQEGVSEGDSTFARLMGNRTGDDAVKQAEANIRIARNNIASVQDDLAKTKKQLEEINPYALNLFGPSPKDLKLKIEGLVNLSAEYERVYKLSKQFINTSKTPKDKTAETAGSDTTVGLSEKEKSAALAREKKFADEYLKILKQRIEDEFKLNQFRYEREIYYNELILNDDQKTSDERIDAYNQIVQVREASAKESFEKELQLNALARIEESKRELEAIGGEDRITKARIQQLFERSKQEIDATLKTGKLREGATKDDILAYEKHLLEIKKLDDKAAKDKQALIDSQVAQIQKQVDKQLTIEDTRLAKEVEAENKKFLRILESNKDNFEIIEAATEGHEKKLFEISQKYARLKVQEQIDALELLQKRDDNALEGAKISTKERLELDKRVAELKAKLSQVDVENNVAANAKNLENAKLTAEQEIELRKQLKERTIQLAQDAASAVVDFANAIFSAKISNIDAEIAASDAFYDRQIEAAGNDARQKKLLEDEKEKKRLALEKKKRKAEYDAAVFSKVISLFTIAAQTAMASIAALAPPPIGLGPVFGGSLLPFIIGTGAIQAATVLATPIPKYKDGRKGGPAELAWTGDGFRKEVITDADGSNPVITPDRPTLTYLKKDQRVHRSIDEYKKYLNASILNNLKSDSAKYKEFSGGSNNGTYSKEFLDELKRNTDAVKNNKTNVHVHNNFDLGHEIWRLSNVNWKKP